jgi:hypothetical protein
MRLITVSNTMRSFENAKEPKELFWIDGASHVDLYDKEPFVPTVVGKLTSFFNNHLQSKTPIRFKVEDVLASETRAVIRQAHPAEEFPRHPRVRRPH